ncbi:hypothetical protein TWF506_008665 [Arthrobotrys conoides]|uniref:Uncharacterized protein n=1 Tax=Arthrobotrys conoides TaxID=74498 RepID=A0AAN8NNU2_9PEZI
MAPSPDKPLTDSVEKLLGDYKDLHDALPKHVLRWKEPLSHPALKLADATKCFEGLVSLISIINFKGKKDPKPYADWVAKYRSFYLQVDFNSSPPLTTVAEKVSKETYAKFLTEEKKMEVILGKLEAFKVESTTEQTAFITDLQNFKIDEGKLQKITTELMAKVPNLEKALQAYEKQKSENESNIKDAKRKVRKESRGRDRLIRKLIFGDHGLQIAKNSLKTLNETKASIQKNIDDDTAEKTKIQNQMEDIAKLEKRIKDILDDCDKDSRTAGDILKRIQDTKTAFTSMREEINAFEYTSGKLEKPYIWTTAGLFGSLVLKAVNKGVALQDELNVRPLLQSIVAEIDTVFNLKHVTNAAILKASADIKGKLAGNNKPLEPLPLDAFPSDSDLMDI